MEAAQSGCQLQALQELCLGSWAARRAKRLTEPRSSSPAPEGHPLPLAVRPRKAPHLAACHSWRFVSRVCAFPIVFNSALTFRDGRSRGTPGSRASLTPGAGPSSPAAGSAQRRSGSVRRQVGVLDTTLSLSIYNITKFGTLGIEKVLVPSPGNTQHTLEVICLRD